MRLISGLERTIKRAAFTGITLFAVIGLLPSSLLGGTVGLKIANHLFDSPVVFGFVPRLIVGMSLLCVVISACIFFVAFSILAAWLFDTFKRAQAS